MVGCALLVLSLGCPEAEQMITPIITEEPGEPAESTIPNDTAETPTVGIEKPTNVEPTDPVRQRYENADNWATLQQPEELFEPSVRLIYFLPNDREVRPERAVALCYLMAETQEFYADEMERHGFGRKTFTVETHPDGVPVVHFFQGRSGEGYYASGTSDFKVWEEVFEHFNDPNHVYFIIVDLSAETLYDGRACGIAGMTFIPSGNGGVAFQVGEVATRHRTITTGETYNGGVVVIPASGYCFRDNVHTHLHELRVPTHELGHAFGLMHDFLGGVPDEDAVVGGTGHAFSRCDVEWLSVSRFFNSGPVTEDLPGSIELLSEKNAPEDVTFRFRIKDPDGLHQVQLLVPETHEGQEGSWGQERLFGCKKVTGTSAVVAFVIPELKDDPADRVILQTIDKRGGIAWATIPLMEFWID